MNITNVNHTSKSINTDYSVNFKGFKLKLKNEAGKSDYMGQSLKKWINYKGLFEDFFEKYNCKVIIDSELCDKNTINQVLKKAGKWQVLYNPYNETTKRETLTYPSEKFDGFDFGLYSKGRCIYREKGLSGLFKKANVFEYEEYFPAHYNNIECTRRHGGEVFAFNLEENLENFDKKRISEYFDTLRVKYSINKRRPFKTITLKKEINKPEEQIYFANIIDYIKYIKLNRKANMYHKKMDSIFRNEIQGTWAFTIGHMNRGTERWYYYLRKAQVISSQINDLIKKGNAIFKK